MKTVPRFLPALPFPACDVARVLSSTLPTWDVSSIEVYVDVIGKDCCAPVADWAIEGLLDIVGEDRDKAAKDVDVLKRDADEGRVAASRASLKRLLDRPADDRRRCLV